MEVDTAGGKKDHLTVEDYRERWSKHRSVLSECMEYSYGFMDKINDKLIFSEKDMNTFDKTPESEIFDILIRKLKEKDNIEPYTDFQDALRESLQSHLAQQIAKDGKFSADDRDRPLTLPERTHMRSNTSNLVQYLVNELTSLLDKMISIGCINELHRISILDNNKRADKSRELLKIVRNRSFDHFENFRQCLKEIRSKAFDWTDLSKIKEPSVTLDVQMTTPSCNKEELKKAEFNLVNCIMSAVNPIKLNDYSLVMAATTKSIRLYLRCSNIQSLRNLRAAVDDKSINEVLEKLFNNLLESEGIVTLLIQKVFLMDYSSKEFYQRCVMESIDVWDVMCDHPLLRNGKQEMQNVISPGGDIFHEPKQKILFNAFMWMISKGREHSSRPDMESFEILSSVCRDWWITAKSDPFKQVIKTSRNKLRNKYSFRRMNREAGTSMNEETFRSASLSEVAKEDPNYEKQKQSDEKDRTTQHSKLEILKSDTYAEKSEETVKRLTECAICIETLTDARLLPCFHTFCLKCLKDYGKDKSPGDEISCPMCRKTFKVPAGGFEEVQVNHFVNKVIEVEKFSDEGKQESLEETTVLCDHCLAIDCENRATAYCVDCNDHLCSTCLQRHKALKLTKTHKTFTLEGKPSLDELIKMTVNHCPDHPNHQIDFYCYDCKTTACVVCFVGEHKEHKCSDIKKSAVQFRQETDEDATKLNNFLKETEEVIKSIDSTLQDFPEKIKVAENAITKQYEDTKVLLEEHYIKLISRLKELKIRREKELHVMKDECEQELLTVTSFQRYWNEIKNRGSNYDIVQTASNLQKRVIELKKQHEQQHDDRKLKSKSDDYQVEFNPAKNCAADGKENMLGCLEEIFSATMMYPKCPDYKQLLNRTKAENLISYGTQIVGIAIHGKEIFMVRSGYQYVIISNVQSPSVVSRNINVPNLNSAVGLVYNEADSFLYVSNEHSQSYIHKINPSDGSVAGWILKSGQPRGLSMSTKNNLLVSYSNAQKVDEFNGSGQLIRSITFSDGVYGIVASHTIELRTGNFIVNQFNPLHRIFLADSTGKVIQFYGEKAGGGVGQLYNPYYADVDKQGNILVADCSNHKLRIFDFNLKYLGDVNTGGTRIGNPWCTCWDRANNRLLVGSGGNVWSISKT